MIWNEDFYPKYRTFWVFKMEGKKMVLEIWTVRF